MLTQLDPHIDDSVTDVLISAHNGVWVQRPTQAQLVPVSYSEAEVSALARDLIDRGGRHIDDATPCADVRLTNGVRVHAVLSGLSIRGTEISIRIPSRHRITLESMQTRGEISEEQLLRLRRAVASRETVLVSGSAGAGKTTLLAALMSHAPPGERLIAIEDVSELNIDHPRVVSLETRQANTEGRGAVDMAELIRQSLRMRPDRLIVGECRGFEVVDMFRAFTTGHSGGGSTLHAKSLADVATRIDSLAALAGMAPGPLARLVCSAIDLVIHVDTRGDKRSISCGRPRVVGDRLEIIREHD